MAVLHFQRHGRIQEWVAEELGLFKKLRLDYEIAHHRTTSGVRPEDEVLLTGDVDGGSSAYRDFVLSSATTNIASTSHWAVSAAIGAGYGKLWPHAYSVMSAGIYVGPDSQIQSASDLARTEIVVGRHSGSHFSAVHALQQTNVFSAIRLKFVEGRGNRLRCLLDNTELAGSMYGLESYILEQKGYRKLIDTSFMVSFMIVGEPNADEVGKYFGALRYALCAKGDRRGSEAVQAFYRPRVSGRDPSIGGYSKVRDRRARRFRSLCKGPARSHARLDQKQRNPSKRLDPRK